MIRAGAMRHQITYRVKSQSTDAYGGPSETWSDFAIVRASVSPIIGKEALESMASQESVDIRIRHRFISGITGAMRVVWNGADYQVIGSPADAYGLGREIEVLARKVGGGA